MGLVLLAGVAPAFYSPDPWFGKAGAALPGGRAMLRNGNMA
jgi:hypothetical protein